uniref:Disease resistance protein winged helix domain-containing protein n=1 Tax=Fagus sylvatica TaxID=28930 RepID=A0A2N9GP00_FAGSY
MKIVKCCGGLPLAITVLGGLLATRRTEGEWDEVFRHVKSYLHEEDNSRLTMVMGLSYDDLPFQLKPCFLYLAHFPEDFEISTKELIRMWMGEGFLPKFSTEEEERIQWRMWEKDIYGSWCRAQGENFLQITNTPSMEVSEAHIDKIRRLAINWDRDDFSAKRDRDDCDPMLPLMISKKYPYVRIKKLPEVQQFSPNLAKLTLVFTELEEDPMATLEKLPNLKILCLREESFVGKNMVCSEGGFPQLQSLVLFHLPKLEEWRVEEGATPSLCRLRISECKNLTTIPDGLRFVTTLWELMITGMPKTFKDSVEDFCKVQHVPSLVFNYCLW